jgi:transcriptional regulator with XRE-family HTH domain
MSTKNDIRMNLNFYLSRINMKQKDFALAVGVSDQAVSNWLNGKNSIDIELVPRICDALGISVDDLFDRKQDHEARDIYYSIVSLNEESKDRVKRYILFEKEVNQSPAHANTVATV